MKIYRRIAIIGAGLAGLSCANALQRAGLDVAVFDKSRAAGGRMSTRRGDDWQCDHGAQYFTARDADFYAEVMRWRAAGVADLWTPRLRVFGEAAAPSADAEVQRFVGVPRMTAPARLLAADLNVRTSATIQRLQQCADGWQLITAEHGSVAENFSAVVLALPAPQAALLLQPVAADLAAVAAAARMRGCWALMLQFAAPLDLPFDAAFVNAGPLRWMARDRSKPGRGGRETWLLHANALWSEQNMERDGADVAAALQSAFVDLGGSRSQYYSAHRWRYANTESPLNEGAIWSAENRLGLCGDWLDGGKVEGAWLSGQKLARQLLNDANLNAPAGPR